MSISISLPLISCQKVGLIFLKHYLHVLSSVNKTGSCIILCGPVLTWNINLKIKCMHGCRSCWLPCCMAFLHMLADTQPCISKKLVIQRSVEERPWVCHKLVISLSDVAIFEILRQIRRIIAISLFFVIYKRDLNFFFKNIGI